MSVPGGRARRARQAATVLGLLALAASALYGGDVLGVRTALQGSAAPARAPAVGRGADEGSQADLQPTRVRSNPWWQEVETLRGEGGTRRSVAIDQDALQWRARWSCDAGRLRVEIPGRPRPLIDAACGDGDDVAYETVTGEVELRVTTEASWELVAEQQLDVPLIEPPLPTMQAPGAEMVAAGAFYDLDQTGRGEVRVYRLSDGGHALRLDGFYVTPNVDLEVRLSPLAAPRTTEEYLAAESVLLAGLDATAGSLNIPLPAGVDPDAFGSVVIWCPPLTSAYAAASLGNP